MVAIEKINPFRYRGYYYDTETGFYYLQTRYYDPTICRFINADNYELVGALASVPGQLNLYAYANNNPIMYTDETGEGVLTSIIIGVVVGVVMYAASEGVSYAVTGEWTWSWGAFIGSAVGGGIGGAIGLVAGTIWGAVAGGFSSSMVGMSMQNILGEANYSVGEILFASTLSALTSGVGAGIMKGVAGFNANGAYAVVSQRLIQHLTRNIPTKLTFREVSETFFKELYQSSLDIFQDLY